MAKKNNKKQSFLRKIFSPMVLWNVGGMAVFVVAVLVGVWAWMERYTMHGESVAVPDVEGVMADYAVYRLETYGLEAYVVDSTYNEDVAPGEVLDQHPKAGSRVKPGRTIHLTINNFSAPALPMPDIADNCSRNQAETRLRAMGFKVTAPVLTSGDKDWVYCVRCQGRDVVAGQCVPIDMPVTLVVGNGNGSKSSASKSYVDDRMSEDDFEDLF